VRKSEKKELEKGLGLGNVGGKDREQNVREAPGRVWGESKRALCYVDMIGI